MNYCDIAIMGESPILSRRPTKMCLITPVRTALLLFDMAITFADEYTYMWKGRKTGVTVLFLANRYCMLAQYILAPVTDCIRFYDTTVSFMMTSVEWY